MMGHLACMLSFHFLPFTRDHGYYDSNLTININIDDNIFNLYSHLFSFFVPCTGALLSVINDVKNDQLNAGDSVLSQVKGLHNKASLIAQDAMPFLQQSSPEYFQKFKKQVSYPWSNFKPFTNKKLSAEQYRNKPQNRRNLIDFSEETSDRCMTELTGTAKGLAFGQPCHISDECWDLMLPVSEGAQGYALTHLALFFQLGEIQGKDNSVENGLTRVKNFSSTIQLLLKGHPWRN